MVNIPEDLSIGFVKGFLAAQVKNPPGEHILFNNPSPTIQIMKGKWNEKFARVVISDGESSFYCIIKEIPEGMPQDNVKDWAGAVLVVKSFSMKRISGKLYVIIRDADYLGTYPAHHVPIFDFKSSDTDSSVTASAAREIPSVIKRQPHIEYTPIKFLSPFTHKWCARVRVASKSEIRTYRNGAGKLFNVTFIDETGEIRGTAFGESVDAFEPLLIPQHVYTISNARIQAADKRFSKHQYDLILEKNTQISECNDSDEVPEVFGDFVSLGDLADKPADSIIDVLGVVHSSGELTEFTSKKGNQMVKRDVTLVDASGTSVRLTLWGKVAQTFKEEEKGKVIAAKEARVSDFNGKSLSLGFNGQVIYQPNLPEAYTLQGWYQNNANNGQFKNVTSGSSDLNLGSSDKKIELRDVEEKGIGMNEPEFFVSKIHIISIPADRDPYYPACTQEGCQKKVTLETDNTWRCEKCQISIPSPNYRYVMSLVVTDHTDTLWASAFEEVGRQILGMTANELHEKRETISPNYLPNFDHGRFYAKFKSKAETYNGVTRVKHQIFNLTPVNIDDEFAKLQKDIAAYSI